MRTHLELNGDGRLIPYPPPDSSQSKPSSNSNRRETEQEQKAPSSKEELDRRDCRSGKDQW